MVGVPRTPTFLLSCARESRSGWSSTRVASRETGDRPYSTKRVTFPTSSARLHQSNSRRRQFSYYKMQKAIFDHRSLCTTGRATRVWEVIEVASLDKLQPLEGSHTMVLMDVWLDAGSTEGDIQREIFADFEKIANALQAGVEPKGFAGMDDKSKQMLQKCLLAQDWHRYFLTLVREWQGMTSKEVAEAAEPDSTLFGAPPATVRLSSFPHADLSRTSLSQPSDLLPHDENPFNRRHCPKRQSRVIFKQVCVALHDVSKLGDAMIALLSCVFGEILCSHCTIAYVLIGST